MEESLKSLINIQKKSGFGQVDERLNFCFQLVERMIETLYVTITAAPFSLRVICKMCFEQLSNKVYWEKCLRISFLTLMTMMSTKSL